MTELTIALFVAAAACAAIRLLRGPDLVDRVIALDVLLISLMGAITVDAARGEDTTNLIALVVLSIIGFTATTAASRFIHQETTAEKPT